MTLGEDDTQECPCRSYGAGDSLVGAYSTNMTLLTELRTGHIARRHQRPESM